MHQDLRHHGLAASTGDFIQGRLRCGLIIEVVHHHRYAFFGEADRYGPANIPAAAGNNCYFSIEFGH